jgi:hypothetical protein
MGNMDSFTVAVVIGVVLMLGIMVVLIAVDKGPPPPDSGKPRGNRPS